MPVRLSRPDLATFAVGALYRHSATGELVEFVGIAYAARREDTEDLGVFRYLDQSGPPLVATRDGYEHGEIFELIHPADADALEITAAAPRNDRVGRFDRDDMFGVRASLDQPSRNSRTDSSTAGPTR
jgi:hypothetical protein